MPDGPLPLPPRTAAPAARRALDLYARLYRGLRAPVIGRRRAVLAMRLAHAVAALSGREAASYYAQLTAWRREDG